MSISVGITNRLKGMKIRQEFICPITHDLLRDPVVLADGKFPKIVSLILDFISVFCLELLGHTYERSAIEKWIKANPPDSRFIGYHLKFVYIPIFSVPS